ncbi:MAG: ABC transporter permease [Acidobacteriia bacterium]|nr:ABC transporter permease [Terriglobia bacterium]
MWRDICVGVRALLRNRSFTAAAVLTLALGVGANTAIFSVIDEVLLRPFPLPDPGQMAQVYTFNRKTAAFVSSSYPDYEDFRRRSHSFQQLAAYVRLPLNVTFGGHTERITVEGVTDNYFAMLGLPPVAGRTLGSEDEPSGLPVAMIGESLWRRRFGRDPALPGRAVTIEGRPFTIAGVVPERYRGVNLNWNEPPEIWIPLHASALVVPGFQAADIFRRRLPWLVLTGRLRPGVTAGRAEAELAAVAAAMAQEQPATNRDLTVKAFPLSRSKFWPSYRDSLTRSLAVFAAAAGLVLLMACANISNLLLQRGLERRREFAIRLAVGAGRGALARQLMVENLLLAIPGFGCALLVAPGLERLLLRFPGALGVTLALQLRLEGRVLLFSLALSAGAAVLFGLIPALQAIRPAIWPALKSSGGGPPGLGRNWMRSALVAVQVGFSAVLLVGGGLFARSLLQSYAVDTGFRGDGIAIAEFGFPVSASAERVRGFRKAVLERAAAFPGVQSATLANAPLLSAVHTTYEVSNGAAETAANGDLVGPDFLRTMGIPLLGGREFTMRDDDQGPRVVVVNQTLAVRLWHGGEATGQSIRVRQGAGAAFPAQVIGVARDSKYHSVWERPEPHFYLPLLQSRGSGSHLLVRGHGRPEELLDPIRKQWDAVAPGAPLLGIGGGRDALNRSLGPQRAAAALLGGFALLAVLLASIGLYSVMAHSVAGRTREIGIRVAVGASPETIVREIVADAARLAAVGLIAGAAGALAAGRLIASQLNGVSTHDPGTFCAVAALLAAVSLAAAWIPARRAARVDPAVALRCE